MLMLCLKVWCLSRQSWEGASISAVQICFKNCQKHLQLCISIPNYVSLMVGTEKSLRNVIDISGYPPKQRKYWEIYSWRPWDFLRPKRVEGREKSRGRRGLGRDFPIPPKFWWTPEILLIINLSTGMDQEIHPCGHKELKNYFNGSSCTFFSSHDGWAEFLTSIVLWLWQRNTTFFCLQHIWREIKP